MNNGPEVKTPVSALQELCTKWGIVPKYELISQKGPVHDPVFEYQVSTGEHSATAKGNSKKKAKHNAAESLISVIKGSHNGLVYAVANNNASETDISGVDSSNANNCFADNMNTSEDGNIVGQLQELTQRRRWPPPVYECTSECGPAHSREYIYTVRLLNLTEKGTGHSKKIAKKNAAAALMRSVESFGSSLGTQVGSENVAEALHIKVDTEFDETVQDLKQGIKKLNLLNPQGLSLNVPSTNYCQMLEEIAEEQGFTTTYVNLNELTPNEQNQCLVQLSLLPVAVCHGVGCSIEDAQLVAAHNALQYLKIMTRKT